MISCPWWGGQSCQTVQWGRGAGAVSTREDRVQPGSPAHRPHTADLRTPPRHSLMSALRSAHRTSWGNLPAGPCGSLVPSWSGSRGQAQVESPRWASGVALPAARPPRLWPLSDESWCLTACSSWSFSVCLPFPDPGGCLQVDPGRKRRQQPPSVHSGERLGGCKPSAGDFLLP